MLAGSQHKFSPSTPTKHILQPEHAPCYYSPSQFPASKWLSIAQDTWLHQPCTSNCMVLDAEGQSRQGPCHSDFFNNFQVENSSYIFFTIPGISRVPVLKLVLSPLPLERHESAQVEFIITLPWCFQGLTAALKKKDRCWEKCCACH